jgi:hypothetical protein
LILKYDALCRQGEENACNLTRCSLRVVRRTVVANETAQRKPNDVIRKSQMQEKVKM